MNTFTAIIRYRAKHPDHTRRQVCAALHTSMTQVQRAIQWGRENGMARPRKKHPQKRPCLGCGAIYQPEHKHNHLCPACRRRNEILGDWLQ
jgi:Zn finger protein HypA/HybF involved in hydrogenase expression